jgi:Calcineurin-like phosphoesterase
MKQIMIKSKQLFIRVALMLVILGQLNSAQAQQAKTSTEAGFSFVVFGDSRSMMYLPFKEDQEPEARKLMVNMFSLVLPEKVSEAMVAKDVKLTYDPSTKELIQMVMPFTSASEITTLKIDKGWVTEASVENIKLLPGVSRTMYRLDGGEWVDEQIVKEVRSGKAKFILSTGDLVWWGLQGSKPSENPYWKLFRKEILNRLPAPDRAMRDAGLDGRFFLGVGNHETWADSSMEGMLTTFPYLKKFGVTPDNLIYKFDFDGVRFIFLWTGKYDYRAPTAWGSTRPPFADQMKQLQVWLDECKITGIHKVFIAFHNPVFARSGMGAIPEAENPHKTISAYAKNLDIVVFNGHVHTTQIYNVDGVKYLLLGGGGAEQDPILPGHTHLTLPANYPQDSYWKGASPKEEYNYVMVDVRPGQSTKFTLNRFRPWSAEPFETVDLFGPSK